MIKKQTKLLILATICVFFAGCQSFYGERTKTLVSPKYAANNYFLYPDFNSLDINNVAIGAFTNTSEEMGIEEKVKDIFLQELNKVNKFEISPCAYIDNNKQLFKINGRYTKKDLLDIAKNYHIDAVLMVEITHYKAYRPLVLGLKIKMVQTITGDEVWLVDELYDSTLAKVTSAAKEYYFANIDNDHTLYKWKVMFKSMRHFIQFVCYDIFKSLNYKKIK